MMRYDKLEKETRETIIIRFLESIDGRRGLSNVGIEYVKRFAYVSLNGRQVSYTLARRTISL